MSARIPPPHPGEVLREEFLEPMGLSVYAVAKAIGIPRSRINAICRGEQGITAAVALRLGKFFGVDPRWFMNMQTQYDLAIEADRLVEKIAAIEPRPSIEEWRTRLQAREPMNLGDETLKILRTTRDAT